MMIDMPAVRTTTGDCGPEGTALLVMESILTADLLEPLIHESSGDRDEPRSSGNPKKLQATREAFINAIAAWPPTRVLELRTTSLPNIIYKPQGRCWITLALRVLAASEELAREETIRTYLELRPLLSGHFNEAEFYPVTENQELEERLAPFKTRHTFSVKRRRENIGLSAPLRKSSLGFGADVFRPDSFREEIFHTNPWVPSLDDWSRLLDVLAGLLAPMTVLVRLRPGVDPTETIEALTETIVTCESYQARLHERRLPIERRISPIRDITLRRAIALRDGAFDLGVFLLSPEPINPSIANVLGSSITETCGLSSDRPFEGRFIVEASDPEAVGQIDHFPDREPFDAKEVACAFRLPSPPSGQIPGLSVKHSRTSFALLPYQDPSEKGMIRLFVNEHQGVRQPICSGVADRMRHVFVIGQTGTGKSTLMENMILQDILAGRGVAVIDPHGDMVDNILASIPPERAEDVICFDLVDRERPIGFNPIEWSTIEERDLLIDELYLTIDRIYDMKTAGGPIFEMNFRSMMKLLMGDGSKARKGFSGTLLNFMSCYTNGNFREWLTKTIDDPQLAEFILELERTRGEASLSNLSPYITSKFSRFVNDSALRRIIGQEKTGFDIDDIMNTGKIFLVKLGKGHFGSNVSALLTNMLVTRFKLAAMKRGSIPVERRRDFFLYVDEAHNLPSDNFMELLSEARKYRMSLVLSTQYCGQLTKKSTSGVAGNDLLSAISGNVGTTIIFRLGSDDAREMARMLYPYFTALDIIGLPNFHGYTRTLLKSESLPPFSFRAEPNTFPKNPERGERIRELSGLKYGRDKDLVDRTLRARRDFHKEDDSGENTEMDGDEEKQYAGQIGSNSKD